jgi:DNA-binding NarL/FixJ family response regulator
VTRPIRIVLVEDNAIFRETLELLLGQRSDIDVVAAVGDGETAADTCERLLPDVVLMDYRLPGMDGVQATQSVLVRTPTVAVVCLTGAADARERDALMEAGARACLHKDQDLNDIVAAIRDAAGHAPD